MRLTYESASSPATHALPGGEVGGGSGTVCWAFYVRAGLWLWGAVLLGWAAVRLYRVRRR